MPENPDFITPKQYRDYQAAWEELITQKDDDAFREAFRVADAPRLNFLNFSLDQVVALVTAPGVHSIKARFLLRPASEGLPRFSVALFASDTPAHDADVEPLSPYYIPTAAAPTTTQAVEPAPGPDTKTPYVEAYQWLTEWVNTTTDDFTTEIFNTDSGPLLGGNFEVSTLQDPLAAAPPYANKSLFLNLGLMADPEPTAALVVYIAPLGSRMQGSVEGLPTGDVYYDHTSLCPPNH